VIRHVVHLRDRVGKLHVLQPTSLRAETVCQRGPQEDRRTFVASLIARGCWLPLELLEETRAETGRDLVYIGNYCAVRSWSGGMWRGSTLSADNVWVRGGDVGSKRNRFGDLEIRRGIDVRQAILAGHILSCQLENADVRQGFLA